jgi:hypothetical protein
VVVEVVPVLGAARDTGIEPEVLGRISIYTPAVRRISTWGATGALAFGGFRNFLGFMADPFETL